MAVSIKNFCALSMKQHISVDQLNELSEKGKEALRTWWKPDLGDFYSQRDLDYRFKKDTYVRFKHEMCAAESYDSEPPSKKNYAYLLLPSIGQMIEILNTPIQPSNPYDGGFIDTRDNGTWMVCTGPFYYNKELCDVLWEAVKEFLERK